MTMENIEVFLPGTKVVVIVPAGWRENNKVRQMTVREVVITEPLPHETELRARVHYTFKEREVLARPGMHSSWVFATEAEALKSIEEVDAMLKDIERIEEGK
jgi:hypothetical protein